MVSSGGNAMRIITGSARGTRLKSPAGEGTRPTADRTREALFSMLGARVYDAHVLDLFAGTGALALEALSRGAESAVLIDRATYATLAENARRTKLEARAEIRRGDVYGQVAALTRDGRTFNLIFADPPYACGDNVRVLAAVDAGALLAAGGFFVLEQGADEPLITHSGRLSLMRERCYGAARICFYTQEVQK